MMRSAGGRVSRRGGWSSIAAAPDESEAPAFRMGRRSGGAQVAVDQGAIREVDEQTTTGVGSHSLPIGKLMGIPRHSKLCLKAHGVTTCGQLLAVAKRADEQEELARASGLALDELKLVVDRADMARVNGIGWMFGMMLESLGIQRVADLAMQNPPDLHARLADQNRERRLARRSPTLDEVTRWVAQARELGPGAAH